MVNKDSDEQGEYKVQNLVRQKTTSEVIASTLFFCSPNLVMLSLSVDNNTLPKNKDFFNLVSIKVHPRLFSSLAP